MEFELCLLIPLSVPMTIMQTIYPISLPKNISKKYSIIKEQKKETITKLKYIYILVDCKLPVTGLYNFS